MMRKGDVTNNTEYLHLQTTEAAKPLAFSLFECDLFAVTLLLSKRVCQRLCRSLRLTLFLESGHIWAQSKKTSRVPFHLFLLKRSLGFLYFSTQWQQQPPSQGDKFMFLFLSTRKPSIWEALCGLLMNPWLLLMSRPSWCSFQAFLTDLYISTVFPPWSAFYYKTRV